VAAVCLAKDFMNGSYHKYFMKAMAEVNECLYEIDYNIYYLFFTQGLQLCAIKTQKSQVYLFKFSK
jgi:hypothetical protein